jgi:hypothetical protein
MPFDPVGQIVQIPLGPQSDPGKSPNAGTALLENCYVEALEGGKVQFTILPDPGLRLFSAIGGTGTIRGIFALGNLLYTVSGEALYRVTSVGAATNLGTIVGQKPVIIVANRKVPDPQITIIADTKRYTLTGSTLTELPVGDLPAGVHSATFLQGRTIYGLNDGRFYPSAVNDSTDIDPLVFGEAEVSADNGVRVFTNSEELWYFGSESMQPFRGTGNSDSPFEPLQGAASGKGSGLLSKHAVCMFDNAPTWVTEICQVVRAAGYSAQRISNHAVERDIQATKDAGLADEITAFEWTREGHWFFVLCLPGATWVYDGATKLWHKKTSYLLPRSRMKFLANAFDKLIVGDADGTNLYEMSATAYDENGEHLISAVQSSILSGFPAGGTVHEVYVDCEMGLGDGGADPHSAEPQLIMQYTKDGGHTWQGNRMRPLGEQGHYQGRVKYTRLGSFGPQGIAFRFSCSAPIKRAVLQAYARVEPNAAI